MGKQTPKTEYNAAYVKTLEASVQELRDENERLRHKLERMNGKRTITTRLLKLPEM